MDTWTEIVRKDLEDFKFDEAISVCQKQMEKKGAIPLGFYMRIWILYDQNKGSLCYAKKGLLEKALEDIDTGFKVKNITNKEKIGLAEQKANILWEMGRYEDAVKFLEETQHLDLDMSQKLIAFKAKYREEAGIDYGHEDMKKIETFLKWMRDNGAKFNKIRMKYYAPDYRGVHAFKPIKGQEVFLSVPQKLIITPQLGRETELGKLFKNSGFKLNWDYLFYITLFLLEQFHNPESFWKPYMDVYPKSVDTFPMFYKEEEKAMLKGSPILSHVESEIKEITEEYERIITAVPQFKKFTLEEYMRNKMLVISRIFFVKMHGVEQRIMVPLADMFNHHYDKVGQTYWKYNDAEDSFVVKAQRDVPLGDAICENYGTKPNYRFLFYYGFLIDDNRSNAVYVKLKVNPKDPQGAYKERMLGVPHGRNIRTFKFFEDYARNQKTNEKLLSYLRFIEYEDDLNYLGEYFTPMIENVKTCKSARRKLNMPAISIDNEKKMLINLKSIAENNLKGYPHTYEEDVKLLQNEKNLSFNQRNCIFFRMGEKKIYKLMMEMANTGLSIFSKPMKEASLMAKSLSQGSQFSTYIKRNILPLLSRIK